ncbi:MAG TPA: protein-disulfide reductase DsbD domain-containing protein [Pyrinomonadaceae bacterium]|nr:protein-disulfide reductase DsbD domain-containing protein [Pyrinomonadaceae bacterium]
MSKLTYFLIVVLGLLATACSRSSQTKAPPPGLPESSEGRRIASVDVVKVSPEEVTLSPGGSVDAPVRLTIDNRFHVNANPPTFPYLIPTELEVKPDAGVSISFIKYPDPLTRSFEFAEKPLAVYEGETSITVRLQADPTARPGRTNLAATLRVQACDEKVCYPPGSKDVVIPVVVQ